jgi:hypothetical protein
MFLFEQQDEQDFRFLLFELTVLFHTPAGRGVI